MEIDGRSAGDNWRLEIIKCMVRNKSRLMGEAHLFGRRPKGGGPLLTAHTHRASVCDLLFCEAKLSKAF